MSAVLMASRISSAVASSRASAREALSIASIQLPATELRDTPREAFAAAAGVQRALA